MTTKRKPRVVPKRVTLGYHLASDDQYLSSTALFSMNRVLQELLDECGHQSDSQETKPFWVVPSLFNKQTRTFHFAAVNSDCWGLRNSPSNEEKFKEFIYSAVWLLVRIKIDENLGGAFEKAIENLLAGSVYSSAVVSVRKHLDALEEESTNGDIFNNLNAYSIVAGLNPDRRKVESDDTIADRRGVKSDDIVRKSYGAIRRSVTSDAALRSHIRDISDYLKLVTIKNGKEIITKESDDLATSLLHIYYGFKIHRYLFRTGIVYRGCEGIQTEVPDRFEGSPTSEKGLVDQGSFYTQFGDKLVHKGTDGRYSQMEPKDDKGQILAPEPTPGLPLLTELTYILYLDQVLYEQAAHSANRRESWKMPMVLLPIYDTWLGNCGYGGLWGTLTCDFPNKQSRRQFVTNILPQLRPAFEVLSAELAASAIASIANTAIEPPYDLVEHFVKHIVQLQDWERISVLKDGKRLYCYLRNRDSKSNVVAWKLCELGCSSVGDCGGAGRRPRILEWPASGIWRSELLQEIGSDEISAFANVSCVFEYPHSSFVPINAKNDKTDKTRELFDLQVIQQQLDVIRTLIPRVRARRSALRNAAVSIMSRNMSHNIGSHVLVAAQREIANATDDAKTNLLKQVGKLQRHLQSRMDFIAEMATVESFYSPVHDLFSEVLGFIAIGNPIGGWSQPKPIEDAMGFVGQELLLKHISGEENLIAEIAPKVAIDDHKDIKFACPGGTLGWQALYVVLENVIRNVAKHSKNFLSGQAKVQLSIRIVDGAENGFGDFWEVRVWDTCASAFEMDKDRSLVDRINDDFFDAAKEAPKYPRLIDDDGRLERGRWGLREMYICAAYLREVALSDLESIRPPDEPPEVLKAIAVDDDGKPMPTPQNGGGNKAHLGYSFYLTKPKLLAVVVDDDDVLLEVLAKQQRPLAKEGVVVMSHTQFCTSHKARHRAVRHRDVVWLCENEICQQSANAAVPSTPTSPCGGEGSYQPGVSPCPWDVQMLGLLPPHVLRKHEFEEDEWRQFTLELRNHLSAGTGRDAVSLARSTLLKWMGTERGVGASSLEVHFLQVASQKPGHKAVAENKRNNTAVFDYHGYIESTPAKPAGIFRNLTEAVAVADSLAFYERYPSVSPQYAFFEQRVKECEIQGVINRKDHRYLEFQYVAACGVVVLDERVQRASEDIAPLGYRSDSDTVADQYLLRSCLNRMRIFVPPKNKIDPNAQDSVDLDAPDSARIMQWLEIVFNTAGTNLKIDFLIIHQGIIDKIENSESFKESLMSLLKEKRCTLVLCSGRGVPPQAYQNTSSYFWPRFVPVSALLERVVNNPSKFHLISLLEGSRAPHY